MHLKTFPQIRHLNAFEDRRAKFVAFFNNRSIWDTFFWRCCISIDEAVNECIASDIGDFLTTTLSRIGIGALNRLFDGVLAFLLKDVGEFALDVAATELVSLNIEQCEKTRPWPRGYVGVTCWCRFVIAVCINQDLLGSEDFEEECFRA